MASVPMAMAYYNELKKQLAKLRKNLNIAVIFSSNPNEADPEDTSLDTANLDLPARDFLEQAIGDYNRMFGTNYDASADKFQNYYKDLSLRMKRREIDLLVVVNMFLTGFDATTLNTLWVDKNLRHHSLLQAYSRPNRILNSVKTFGNIVCFRDLQQETDEAIALFGHILRLRNILTAFDDFKGNEILTPRQLQDYQGIYLDLYQKPRPGHAAKEDINSDLIFEIELVRQVEINIDYILMLVEKYRASHCKDKTILAAINSAVNSSIELRSKKELIEGFIANINSAASVPEGWQSNVAWRKEADLKALIAQERLKPAETRKFLESAFKSGELKTLGEGIQKIMPPTNPFDKAGSLKKRNYRTAEGIF
ncbi:MAG: hypothetical protein HDQ44_01750 [Desulfovibrio sp.]|nr:hypothetical protein [Desulfovibrio sp.]